MFFYSSLLSLAHLDVGQYTLASNEIQFVFLETRIV